MSATTPWFEYLDKMHNQLWEDHPELAQLAADAREWESPMTFLSASFLANSKPAELERLLVRMFIMKDLSAEERRALIIEEQGKQMEAWAKHAAEVRRRGEGSSAGKKFGVDDLDLSSIKI